MKKALITNILGKDLSQVLKRNAPKSGNEIYENDTYVITCVTDSSRAHDISGLFALNRHPDMCLLVVDREFSVEHVWEQIENLSKTTGKPTDEFLVVPPPSYKSTGHYPFIFDM